MTTVLFTYYSRGLECLKLLFFSARDLAFVVFGPPSLTVLFPGLRYVNSIEFNVAISLLVLIFNSSWRMRPMRLVDESIFSTEFFKKVPLTR